jgi:hypothetical protein
LHLPVIQYTVWEIRGGNLSWVFAQAGGASPSAVFASRILRHLDHCGASLRALAWQTDNGGEFQGGFPKGLGYSLHVTIPPAARIY